MIRAATGGLATGSFIGAAVLVAAGLQVGAAIIGLFGCALLTSWFTFPR